MRLLIFFSFIASISPNGFASIPTNGVIQTSETVGPLVDPNNAESPLNLCKAQSTSARYFSNTCTHLIDNLRKKMNTLALEADLQMQAEKLGIAPLKKDARSRIALLAKINSLSSQSEDLIKAYDSSKNELTEIVLSVEKVQTTIAAYSKMFPRSAKYSTK